MMLGAISVWFALDWTPALLAVVLFAASSALLLFLALRPPIEIRDDCLVIGRTRIPWPEIQRVDSTGWVSPLIIHLTLVSRRKMILIHPGDPHSSSSLLRNLRAMATAALIDGIPYRQFWGKDEQGKPPRQLPSPDYRILRKEDEDEVERLYRRLKTVGHLDSKDSSDEK